MLPGRADGEVPDQPWAERIVQGFVSVYRDKAEAYLPGTVRSQASGKQESGSFLILRAGMVKLGKGMVG